MRGNERITVFTPAYNRAHTLPRTYESLCNQTDKRFVWMIVDDGSKDNTRELVDSWIAKDVGFSIEYYYKENGGMHTAHNVAYEHIRTELNVCIDSDDAMPPTAIEDILNFWDEKGSPDIAGIIALDSDLEGKLIGSGMPKEIEYATTDELYDVYGVSGDKKYIYRTDIITSVAPYPEYEGEKLVPLGYKYILVADHYKMALMDKVVCLEEYQADGSSNTIYRQYLQSPRGFAISKTLRMTRSKAYKNRVKNIAFYVAECRIAKDKNWLKNSPLKLETVLYYPLGIIFHWHILWKNKH